jgi:tRNA pseudouridine38-40 synthase
MNFKLIIQYDGTDFHGWQIQGELRTVQGELTRALSLVDGRDVILHGSGRTDAGVHAEGQVANVLLEKQITPERLRAAINGNTGKDVRVIHVEVVSEDFHARYSALEKTYLYRVINGPVMSPFWLRYAHQEARPLDLEHMRLSAKLFLGTHDWTAFSAAQSDVDSRTRTINRLEVSEALDRHTRSRMIEITVSADGFLRYMVRFIVGALLMSGRHEIDESRLKSALVTGTRAFAAEPAPAKGLTLKHVSYDVDHTLLLEGTP